MNFEVSKKTIRGAANTTLQRIRYRLKHIDVIFITLPYTRQFRPGLFALILNIYGPILVILKLFHKVI